MKELVVRVEGMSCEGCAASVQEKLASVPGVQEVKVSLPNHTARIQASDDVTEPALADALKGSGYAVMKE